MQDSHRDAAEAAREAPVRFDTKIAVVVREDLPVWQKLNVTAFLMSGIAGQHPDILGGPYRDADGREFNALCKQPIICMVADAATLSRIHQRAIERDIKASAYTEEMFATGHDAANRAVFAQYSSATARIVGIALRDSKKRVDKVVDGARMHP
jgi:hypothetical protein